MFTEDDLLPISALQHLLFCPRRCGLIHLEQAWAENRLTAEGRQLHERTHQAGPESRGDVRIVRGLRLQSLRLGLSGQADVVELRPAEKRGHSTFSCTDDSCRSGLPPHQAPPSVESSPEKVECPLSLAAVPGLEGLWSLCPVEYKRGVPKINDCDRVQLCAQAMCLEEMLNVQIPAGALFYGQPRRREQVAFDPALREKVADAARRLHELVAAGVTPSAEYGRKCRSCSMLDLCMPASAGSARSAARYLARQIGQATRTDTDSGGDDTEPPAPETPP